MNGLLLSSIPSWRANISYVKLSNTTVDDDLLVIHDKPERSSNFWKNIIKIHKNKEYKINLGVWYWARKKNVKDIDRYIKKYIKKAFFMENTFIEKLWKSPKKWKIKNNN